MADVRCREKTHTGFYLQQVRQAQKICRENIMLPEPGDKITVTDLPSYRASAKPSLPTVAVVLRVTDHPMVIVEIEGIEYELYEDDGYKAPR
jgi:hypothetical protein